MAGNWKKIVKCIVFILLTTACILGAYRVFKWKDTSGDYTSSIEQLKNTPKNTIDVVFTGTSHTYCGVCPAVFWADSGYSVFDMSISGQDKYSSYYCVKELLKTQSPEVVVVDLYPLTFREHAVDGNLHRNMMALPQSAGSMGLLLDYFGTEDKESRKRVADYTLRWPIVHTRYRELDKYDFLKNPVNEFLRGENMFFEASHVEYQDVNGYGFHPEELSDEDRQWIDNMIALSEKENFSLVFTVIPFHATAEDQAILDGVIQYIEGRNVPVLDMNRNKEILNLDVNTDFIDNGHLNIYGAEKLSKYYLQYLQENYNLKDHRADTGYRQWNMDTEYLNKAVFENSLRNAITLEELLTLLSTRDDYVTIICLELDYQESEFNYKADLAVLGMDFEDYKEGGVWVYENGVMERLSYNDEDAEAATKKLGKYDTLSAKFHGDLEPENVMISTEDISNYGYYLKVTAYDKDYERIALQRGF